VEEKWATAMVLTKYFSPSQTNYSKRSQLEYSQFKKVDLSQTEKRKGGW